MTLPILVQYNVPRFIIGKPGKQNHACTGDMSITPGVAFPFDFVWSNNDGVPINLSHFQLTIVFWHRNSQYELLPANILGNCILAKDLIVDDPYAGTAALFLTDQDTLRIGASQHGSVRWSLYMIDQDADNTFAAQITSEGGLYGICHVNYTDMPTAEIVRGLSRVPNTP